MEGPCAEEGTKLGRFALMGAGETEPLEGS
jgi:hypothetical protein